MAEQDKNFAVLYVDDERKSLKMFRLLCEDEFRVMTASNARQGLALLNMHKDEIGVIVADRCMAKPTGIWLLHRARQLHPHVVRLLASDGCNRAAEESSLRDGTAQGMVPIPWEPEELNKMLRLELERFAAQRGRPSGSNGVNEDTRVQSPE